ncbi:MAG: OmpA family protein [bacterium]
MSIKINNPFEQEFWPCFTDIICGLLALFVFILVISLFHQSTQARQIKAQEQKLLVIKKRNEKLEEDLQGAVKAGLITIEDGHIDIMANILFPVGSNKVSKAGRNLLKELSSPLNNYILDSPDMIMVSGFTDDILIRNQKFPSNWELSTARATEVVKLLITFGVQANKVFAAGFGEFHPIVVNSDEVSRKRNRRVEISRVPVQLP